MAKLAFLLCSLLMVSALAVPTPVRDDNLIDIIKKIVHAAENLLDQLLSAVSDIINNIDADWEAFQAKLIVFATDALGLVFDTAKKSYDRIAENSSDAGKKLVQCLEDVQADVISVPVTFLDDTTKCFGADLEALVKTLGPLLSDLSEIQIDAKTVADKIDECSGSDVSTILCVAEVIQELLQVAAKIPEVVQQDLELVLTEVVTFINTAIECGKSNVDPYYQNAGKVLDTIATCASV